MFLLNLTMIKRLLFFSLIFFVVFVKAQTTVVDSIFVNSNGIYRTYRIYIPAMYNGSTARPLVFNLHGYTSNALAQQQYTYFEPIADTANFLMVYPQGTKDASNQPYWNAGISPFGIDDVDFISCLIDSLALQYNINLNRVYSCGLSNGGFMSQTLACRLSDRITAIAGVASSMYTTQYGSNCIPTRPVPVMQVSGTADGTVPYNGSSVFMHVDTVVKYWVKKNNCNTTPVFSNIPNTNTFDGCTAERYVYSNGNSGSTVELYKIIGGGHSWPGSPFIIGVTNQDYSASKEIWRFFNQYNLATLTSVAELNKTISVNIYPNPANDYLEIKTKNQFNEIEIHDLLGKTVLTYSPQELAGGGFFTRKINIETLNSGIYILSLKKDGVELGNAKFVKE